ncbi:hypothetical protein V1524DRAFT_135784 [Lipomyces starkeyi]
MALGKDAILTVENAIENPASSSNLLSIANGRGLFAIAITGGFIVSSTSTLRQKFSDADKTLRGLVHRIPEPLQFLTFTSDEQHLIVVGQAGGTAWYFVDDLRQEGAKPQGFFRKGPLLDIKCNPRNGKSAAVLASNGTVYHIDLPSSSLTRLSKGQVTSFDWASNGQQLVVGNTDGVLTQYTIAGETVAQVLPPSDIEDKFVIFVLWIESHRFLVIYSKPPAPKVHDYELFVVTREPNKFTYSKIFDSCPPFGLTFREGWWYSITIRNWNREKLPFLILLASTPSIDIALMTEKHTFYLLDDTKRASLPFHHDKDTSPVGMALDLTATDRILNPKPGVEDAPALPVLWVLNNVGQLKAWNVVWGAGVAEKIADVNGLLEQHKRIVEGAAAAPSLAPLPSLPQPPPPPATAPEPVDAGPASAPAPAPTPAPAPAPAPYAEAASADAEQAVTDERVTVDTTTEEPEHNVVKKPDEAPEPVPESTREPEAQLEATPDEIAKPEVESTEPTVYEKASTQDDNHVEGSKTGPAPVPIAEPESKQGGPTELEAATDKNQEQQPASKRLMSPAAQASQLPSQLAGSNIGVSIPSFGQKSATVSTTPLPAPVTSAPSMFSQYANAPSLMEAKTGGGAAAPFAGFGQTPGLAFGGGIGQQARIAPVSIPPVTSSPAPFGGPVFGQPGLFGPSPFGAYANRPAFSFGQQSSFGQPALPQAAIKPPGFPVPPLPASGASPFGQFAGQHQAGASPFGHLVNQQQAGSASSSPFGQLVNQQPPSSFTQLENKAASAKTEPKSTVSQGATAFGARLGPTRDVAPGDQIESDYEDVSGEEGYDDDGEEYDSGDYDENGEEYDEEYDEEGEEDEEGYDDEYESEADDDEGVTKLLAQATVEEADAQKSAAPERTLSTGSLRADAMEFKLHSPSTSPSNDPGSATMERRSSSKSLRFEAPEFVFKPVSPAASSLPMASALETPSPVFGFANMTGVAPPKKSHAIEIKFPSADDKLATKKEDVKLVQPLAKSTEEPKSVLSPATAASLVTPSKETAQELPAASRVFSFEATKKVEGNGNEKPAGLFSFSASKADEPAEESKSVEKMKESITKTAEEDEKPDGPAAPHNDVPFTQAGFAAPKAETPASAPVPTDQAKPAASSAAPTIGSAKSTAPLIDVESKPVTPMAQKPAEKMPETNGEVSEEKVQTEKVEEDEEMESEDIDYVSEEADSSLLNVDEAPVNVKFSNVPPPVPEYLQMSSVEEYQTKETGLAKVFDLIYHDTANELDIIRRNASRLSKFLEAHTAQHLIRHSKEDFNEPEEWRLAEVSNLTSMIDELMQEARNIKAENCKDEAGLHEVEAAILKLDSKLTTAGDVLKQRSDPKYTARLKTRALPPDALELQREIRQKTQEVSRHVDELERENTHVKSKLSAAANNGSLGADMFGTAPSIDGVYKSIQRITRFAQRRALDVSNLRKVLDVMQDENSIAGSPRTPGTPLAISGSPLNKGTPGSIVYAGTPARSDNDFGGSPQKLSIDEETVEELIARKKMRRKFREFMLQRPESVMFTNEK